MRENVKSHFPVVYTCHVTFKSSCACVNDFTAFLGTRLFKFNMADWSVQGDLAMDKYWESKRFSEETHGLYKYSRAKAKVFCGLINLKWSKWKKNHSNSQIWKLAKITSLNCCFFTLSLHQSCVFGNKTVYRGTFQGVAIYNSISQQNV